MHACEGCQPVGDGMMRVGGSDNVYDIYAYQAGSFYIMIAIHCKYSYIMLYVIKDSK